jgi:hypothetical protein
MISTGPNRHYLGTTPRPRPRPAPHSRLVRFVRWLFEAVDLPNPYTDRVVVRRVHGVGECPRCCCELDACDCRY